MSCVRFSNEPLGCPNVRGREMAEKKATEPLLKLGDKVKIRSPGGFGGMQAKIVELRGPLGPGGSQIYRIRVRGFSKPTFIEVREDQLILIPSET